jgi:hypothetical protein
MSKKRRKQAKHKKNKKHDPHSGGLRQRLVSMAKPMTEKLMEDMVGSVQGKTRAGGRGTAPKIFSSTRAIDIYSTSLKGSLSDNALEVLFRNDVTDIDSLRIFVEGNPRWRRALSRTPGCGSSVMEEIFSFVQKEEMSTKPPPLSSLSESARFALNGLDIYSFDDLREFLETNKNWKKILTKSAGCGIAVRREIIEFAREGGIWVDLQKAYAWYVGKPMLKSNFP